MLMRLYDSASQEHYSETLWIEPVSVNQVSTLSIFFLWHNVMIEHCIINI